MRPFECAGSDVITGMSKHDGVVCGVCGATVKASSSVPGDSIRGAVAQRLKAANPEWTVEGPVCRSCLDQARRSYVIDAIESEQGELSQLEAEVVESLNRHELLSRELNREFDTRGTVGQRVADKVAEFGGSWRFIILFGTIIAVWITINGLALLVRPFDPYPFILLNLVLSCLAALQAPVIMMSQNRQEEKDRLRAEHDYKVNLKAELEIRHLHEKVDHLLMHQMQRLMEMQEVQIEMLEGLRGGT